MIKSELIEEIRTKTDIVQIVGEYVPMKKRGKNYLGLCPFHSEKTPSFTVSQDKQIYHCFGCGEGGNVFSFLMKIENIGFAESVQTLGERLGITVNAELRSPAEQTEKEKYFDIMDAANRYFVDSLNDQDGAMARTYLEKRGVSPEAVKAFQLGYAPDKWDGLLNHLFKKGVSTKDMEKLGLIIERTDKSGSYDRFRGRLMFPIHNIKGKVIGFSGRILTGTEEAKYINSPDSPVYNKGYSIYGIYVTKDEIKKARTAVLVEGNVDLVSCWQYGIRNAIAPLGTAFTQNQAKLIKRFADNVVIAYDRDNAGVIATAKSVEILKDEGLNVRVTSFTGGKDPDEALRSKGAESFLESIKDAKPWVEYKIMLAISRHDLKEIESRVKAAKEAAAIIAEEKDPLLQKGYINLVAEKLGYSSEDISAEVKRIGYYPKTGRTSDARRHTEKPKGKAEAAEEWIIKLASENAGVLEMLKSSLTIHDFTGELTRSIAEVLLSVDLAGVQDIPHKLLEMLPDEDSKKLLSRLLVSEYPNANADQSARDCINTIKGHHLKSRLEQLRSEIAEAEKQGLLDNLPVLHRQFKDTSEAYRSLSIS